MVHKYYDVSAAVKLNFNTPCTTRGNLYTNRRSEAQQKLMPYVAGYGPGQARPGSYINIKWLATGSAYGPTPALKS